MSRFGLVRALFLFTLSLLGLMAAALTAVAQSPLKPGDRVRVTVRSPAGELTQEVEYAGMQDGVLCLAAGVDEQPCRGVPLASLKRVERKVTNVPAMVGAVVGGVAGLALAGGSNQTDGDLSDLDNAMMENALKGFGSVLAGGLVGYLAGYAIGGGERWQVVPLVGIPSGGDSGGPAAGASLRVPFRLSALH